MSKLRTMLAIFAMVFLVGGYFVSQFMQATGSATSYITALDRSAVPYVSLGLLVAAVVLCFINTPEEAA
jgi:hypothetical protein